MQTPMYKVKQDNQISDSQIRVHFADHQEKGEFFQELGGRRRWDYKAQSPRGNICAYYRSSKSMLANTN
jgi:hypothetical protein